MKFRYQIDWVTFCAAGSVFFSYFHILSWVRNESIYFIYFIIIHPHLLYPFYHNLFNQILSIKSHLFYPVYPYQIWYQKSSKKAPSVSEVVPRKERFSFVVPPSCLPGDQLTLKPAEFLELTFAVPENVAAFNVAPRPSA